MANRPRIPRETHGSRYTNPRKRKRSIYNEAVTSDLGSSRVASKNSGVGREELADITLIENGAGFVDEAGVRGGAA